MGRDARRNHVDRTPKPGGTNQDALEAANLAALARQIVDLEHFDTIVATARPSMRSRVRKLLAAHVSFDVPEVVPSRPAFEILRFDDNGE
jgi:protein required for attachment to host cells